MTTPSPLPNLVLLSWQEIALYITTYSAIVLIVGRLLFDDQVRKSLKRSKADVMATLEEWYKDRDADIDAAIELTREHEDRMTAFETSLLQQGEALKSTLAEHSQRQTGALKTITDTLVEIQKEAKQTALAVARMEGSMQKDRRSAQV